MLGWDALWMSVKFIWPRVSLVPCFSVFAAGSCLLERVSVEVSHNYHIRADLWLSSFVFVLYRVPLCLVPLFGTVMSSWWIIPFISMKWLPLSLPSPSLKSVLSDIKGTGANTPRGQCQAPGSGFCCERLCSFCRRVANTGSHLESILCGV